MIYIDMRHNSWQIGSFGGESIDCLLDIIVIDKHALMGVLTCVFPFEGADALKGVLI